MATQDATASIRYLHVNAIDGRVSSGTVGDHMALDAFVGPEGKTRVRLARHHAMAGWVNDCGLLAPDKYPRNVVGSCLLSCLGAAQLALPDAKVHELSELVAAIRQVLGWDPDDPQGFDIAPSWANAIEDFAAFVTAAPTPSITMIGDGIDMRTVIRQMTGGAS